MGEADRSFGWSMPSAGPPRGCATRAKQPANLQAPSALLRGAHVEGSRTAERVHCRSPRSEWIWERSMAMAPDGASPNIVLSPPANVVPERVAAFWMARVAEIYLC